MAERNPYYQGPPSDHFDGVRFFLPGYRVNNNARDILRWQAAASRQKWPKRVPNRHHPAPPERVKGDDLSVTFIGQATALIQTAGLNILTDPFFSERASPMQWAGPRRVRPPGVTLNLLPHIDLVLVSHNHYDHMDLPSIRRLHDLHHPRVLTPLGNAAILARSRRKLKVEEGDWGDSFRVGEAKVTLSPARHWSKRGPRDRNMALWCAFLIETPGGPVYFAADTGYGMGDHFRDIAKRAGPVRLSLLPIGAYQPRWFMRAQHMNPEEAVRAHVDLGAESSLAIHHGTVQLTDEGIGEPAAMLQASLRAYGVPQERFRALDPGESWRIPRLPVRRSLAMAGEGR